MQGKHLFQWFSEHHDLPNKIVELINSVTKDENQRRDLLAKVWVMLGEEEPDKIYEYYLGKAYALIRDRYERYYMPKPKRWASDDAGIQRLNTNFDKF